MTEPIDISVLAPLLIDVPGEALVLQLANAGVTPPAIVQGVTTVTVALGGLVPLAGLGALKLVPLPGWALQPVAAGDTGLTLRATASGTLGSTPLVFDLQGIVAAAPTRVVSLAVGYAGFGELPPVTLAVPLVVQAGPPGPKLPVTFKARPESVYIQPRHQGPQPPVTSAVSLTMHYPGITGGPPLADPKKPGARDFYLSVVYAGGPPGRGALTTKARADSAGLSARPGPTYTDAWSVTPIPHADPPRWHAKPKSLDVLEPNDSVEFILEHIVTDLDPGITSAYLQYEGMPGYANGFCSCDLAKVPAPAGLVSFQLQSDKEIVGEGPVVLAWTSNLHGTNEWLVLTYSENGVQQTLTSKPGGGIDQQASSFVATTRLLETTDFTMVAYNGGQPMQDPITITVDVTPDPVVSALTPTPPPLAAGGPPYVLTWKVKAATSCALSVDGFAGSVPIPMTGDETLQTTLTLQRDDQGSSLVASPGGTIALVAAQAPAGLTIRVTASVDDPPDPPKTGDAYTTIPISGQAAQLTALTPSAATVNGNVITFTVAWTAPGSTATTLSIGGPASPGTPPPFAALFTGVPVALQPPEGGTQTVTLTMAMTQYNLAACLQQMGMWPVKWVATAEGTWGPTAQLSATSPAS